MSDQGLMEQGRLRRAARQAEIRQARRSRRRRRVGFGLVGIIVAVAALLALNASNATDPTAIREQASVGATSHPRATPAPTPRNAYGAQPAPAALQVHIHLKKPLISGLLFDVNTGQAMWAKRPQDVLAIASLTKMMTALVVVAHARPGAQVPITPAAVHFSGSGVGLLPLGKRVRLETLLYGLLLPSGNDAAIALAQKVAGTQDRFIAMMNARAHAMNLQCTHFTTVSGIVDQGNYSCASDLAVLAHAVLTRPRLATIVATRSAVLPFPIKGGKLWLYNNNPLLELGYPGADGVKTGYTTIAGRCLVATARRGRHWLGVVLLHSDDPPDQAQELLNAGFAAESA
jgi:D-alanyl-D-alanine carboxypeptidase